FHRILRYSWPRGRSHFYAGLRRLQQAGLAREQKAYVGRRPRTTYSITPAGRRALRRWLRSPISPPILESEIVLRMLLAPLGDRDMLLDALAQAVSHTHEHLFE